MEFQLDPPQARVFGCLLEKELTTPESYPLTLNSLVSACNQKTAREPVTSYTEREVVRALEGLRELGLVRRVDMAGSRVPKYRQTVDPSLAADASERALIAVLLLRGPQTAGELRTRCERLYAFDSVAKTVEALHSMASAEPGHIPVVVQLPVQPGRKEARFAHLLSGPVETSDKPARLPATEPAVAAYEQEQARLSAAEEKAAALEQRVQELENEMSKIREEWEALRREFT